MDIFSFVFVFFDGLLFGLLSNIIMHKFFYNINYNKKILQKKDLKLDSNNQINQYLKLGTILFCLLNGLLWLLFVITYQFNNVFVILLNLLTLSLFLILFFVSVQKKYLPSIILLNLTILILILLVYNKDIGLQNNLIGMIFGASFYIVIFLAISLVVKSNIVKFVDVLLIAICGLFLGWPNILVAIFLSSLLATITLGILYCKKNLYQKPTMPFASFVIVSTIITLLSGNFVVEAYIDFVSSII